MTSRRIRGVGGALLIAASQFVAATAMAQSTAQSTSANQVAEKTDWSVLEDKDPRECWAVSSPVETVNSRDGRVVAVNRGEILLMTFYRPAAAVQGQVAFTGGYPFAPGSAVTLDVGGTKFELLTAGEWAWPAAGSEDAKIVAAMKRGSDAVLTARSARGTQTRDSFSLKGYTAAVEEAEKRCK